MRKLNNKGFAISTIFYSIIIIGILVMAMLYSTLAFRKKSESDFVDTIEENMNKETYGTANCSVLKNNGSGINTGDVIRCDMERFYVIETSNTQIYMLATNILTQNSLNVRQLRDTELPIVAEFSKNYDASGQESATGKPYWQYYTIPSSRTIALKENYGLSYPTFVFDVNSPIYEYLTQYQLFLRKKLLVTSAHVTLINYKQITTLNNTSSTNSWVRINYNWYTGIASSESPSPQIYIVTPSGLVESSYNSNNVYIRPVVVISKKELGL